jgi:hypothetical protein
MLGWTLAELALALLFALLAAFVPSYRAKVVRLERLEAGSKKSLPAADIENLRKRNADLQSEIEASRKNLKSRITPSCAELDKNSGWLFSATVTSRDSFEIDGETLALDGILKKYADQLADAKRRGCIQQARIYFDPSISAADLDYAYERLRMRLYLDYLGERRP